MQQALPQPLFAGGFGMQPFESQGAGQALTAEVTHLTDHAKDHRRQRPVSAGVVVLARTAFEGRTPEGSHIHRDGVIAFMAVNLPAG